MARLLVTGSAGLVGSTCVRHFAALGWEVWGIDSDARAKFFGAAASVRPNWRMLERDIPGYQHFTDDLCDGADNLVDVFRPDLVIHAAAQPSHDWAATDPRRDFDVNATATVYFLDAVRRYVPDATFVFLSTNKVYGDRPNVLPLVERETRYDYHPDTPESRHGICELMPVDRTTHSLFGCSKLAADLYVQEYGRYFGLKTACFRCGCLTGGAHAGAEQHGFLAYLVRCCREGIPYTIHGYKGKQVRDNLHARDVASAAEAVYRNPHPGEVYNLGGGRANSCSVREAITLAEQATGKKLEVRYRDTPRKGDHKVYISDTGKFRKDYLEWDVTISLDGIFAELAGLQLESSRWSG